MNRKATAPPQIPGYVYKSHLGGGGFADVFLYEQQMPTRLVAIKVLLTSVATEAMRQQFNAEANLMALVSSHPSMVTIYAADVAADGSPYLVMEYCSKDNLAQRYRAGEVKLADALRIAIQLSGAVETAHRVGVLHRDIKPANVLTNDVGRPALTDFGISVTTGSMHNSEQVGLSIPWSPPEMFTANPSGDARADVYSLSATIYTVLARRSPFEIQGRPGTQADLIHRIVNTPLPQLGRPDVPVAVTRVLAKAMHKDPAARYPTALEFAKALQRVQADLGLRVTEVDVNDEDPESALAELGPQDDGLTRIRPLLSIDAQADVRQMDRQRDQRWEPNNNTHTRIRPAGPPSPAGVSGPPGPPTFEQTRMRMAPSGNYLSGGYLLEPPAPIDTQVRPAPAAEIAPPPTPRRKAWPWLIAAGVALLIGGGVAAVLATQGTDSPAQQAQETFAEDLPTGAIEAGVPAPEDFHWTRSGSEITFSWTNPDPRDGDEFQWRLFGGEGNFESTEEPSVTVAAEPDDCIEVRLVRTTGEYSKPLSKACAVGAEGG